MSKSIYNEAIEIMKLNILPRENGKTSKTKVIHALQQAQKQEKLLELYRELATVRDDMLDACKIVDDDYYVIRETETNLKQKIKEIENEI